MTPTSGITNSGERISPPIEAVGKLHGQLVYRRRTIKLAEQLASFLPPFSQILDVGCGDGKVALLLHNRVADLEIQGVEVHGRPNCEIPCELFDGAHLPFSDNFFDGCLFVDVLHHTLQPAALLQEAKRVSRKFILVKDHISNNAFDHWVLRLMDWVGNRPNSVALPYAYLSQRKWNKLFENVGLTVTAMERDLRLYPAPFSLLFNRGLHFIARLEKG